MFSAINLTLDDNPRKRPMSVRKLARYKNDIAWMSFFDICVKRALHRYDIEGLPKTMDKRATKLSLLWHGSVTFFQHMGHDMSLPGAPGGDGLTVYGHYVNAKVYGRNGWTDTVPLWIKGAEEDPMLRESYLNLPVRDTPRGVWFRESETQYPFIRECMKYADALSDTWRKMENARMLTSKAFVVVGSDALNKEAELQSATRLFQDYADNLPFIYLTRKLEEAQKDIIPLNHNVELIKSYTDHMVWLWAQFDRLCGKRAMENPDKLSGMSDAETSSGDEVTYGNIDALCSYMNEYGADVYNEHAGTNIKFVPEGRREDALPGLDNDAGPEQMGENRSDFGGGYI